MKIPLQWTFKDSQGALPFETSKKLAHSGHLEAYTLFFPTSHTGLSHSQEGTFISSVLGS